MYENIYNFVSGCWTLFWIVDVRFVGTVFVIPEGFRLFFIHFHRQKLRSQVYDEIYVADKFCEIFVN